MHTNKQVLVLGAGLAGLAAAYELDQAGHDVTVIEARTRPGGRVLTLREGFAPGLSAEAGAMSFSDGYRHLIRYARLFDLPYVSGDTAAVRSSGRAYHFHLRGQHITPAADSPVDWPFDLSDEEREAGLNGMLREYVLPLIEGTDHPAQSGTLPDWVLPHDNRTLRDLMAERGASPAAQDLISATFWFADMRGTESAAVSLLSDLSMFYRGQSDYGFPGGVDVLPRAFAVRLGDRIRYGTQVIRIEQLAGHIEVVVMAGGLRDRLTADRVVCTIPFSVLRHIEIDPPLPPDKSEIISNLAYHSVTRVFLQMRQPFWQEQGVTGDAMTDLPVGQVQEHPIYRTGEEGRRTILEAHGRGDRALALDALAPDERIPFVLSEMDKVHPGVERYFEGGRVKSWQEDPFSRGALAFFSPGTFSTWHPIIARPEGRLHFAGEHTSIFPSTMEGALESGVRAAREIDEA